MPGQKPGEEITTRIYNARYLRAFRSDSAVSYYSFVKFMFLPSARVKPFGTLIVSRLGTAVQGEAEKRTKREKERRYARPIRQARVRKREGERKKRLRERGRQTDDENSPCMDSGEAGSLSIRPSASLAVTKSATGASLVTSRTAETSSFLSLSLSLSLSVAKMMRRQFQNEFPREEPKLAIVLSAPIFDNRPLLRRDTRYCREESLGSRVFPQVISFVPKVLFRFGLEQF